MVAKTNSGRQPHIHILEQTRGVWWYLMWKSRAQDLLLCLTSALYLKQMVPLIDKIYFCRWISQSFWVEALGYLWSTWHWLVREDFWGDIGIFCGAHVFCAFLPALKGPQYSHCLGSGFGNLSGTFKLLWMSF